MSCYAVVALDATGSMGGQEQRVVSSMNEYVSGLPQDSHVSVFMFDSERWDKFFEGPVADWPVMKLEDYRVGKMTPLYDAVGKIIGHADGLVKSSEDRVMVMVDTDGYENASREHTQQSIKSLVSARQGDNSFFGGGSGSGWAFLFMSSGLDKQAAQAHGATGQSVGMTVNSASSGLRHANYHQAAGQTQAYFSSGTAPISVSEDDQVDKDPVSVKQEDPDHEAFFPV